MSNLNDISNDRAYFVSMLSAFKSANTFLRTLYRSGLFLSRERCRLAAQAGVDFIRAYREVASIAYSMGRTRFKLTPKLHAFFHIVDHLCVAYEAERRWTFSPLGESVQMDEDFVGQISSLTCTVSTRKVHLESVRKYLTNVWSHVRPKRCF